MKLFEKFKSLGKVQKTAVALALFIFTILLFGGIIAIANPGTLTAGANVSLNYVYNGSEWVPWLSTSDGKPKVDLNLLNISAGKLTVSGEASVSGNLTVTGNISGSFPPYSYVDGYRLSGDTTATSSTLVYIPGSELIIVVPVGHVADIAFTALATAYSDTAGKYVGLTINFSDATSSV